MEPEAASLQFGALLRKHRTASGLSQEALADRAGLSAAAISALERGRRRAPYEVTVASLADALELAPDARAILIEASKRTRGRNRQAAVATSGNSGTIPIFISSFVGRLEELTLLREMLTVNRLVTITGSGGVGKTRIACELLRSIAETDDRRVAFVDLAPIVEPTLVLGSIATAIGIERTESEDMLLTALGRQNFLLVFDNCEHLIQAVVHAARAMLQRCPGISILSTSRTRLGILGETVYRLPSLELPLNIHVSIEEAMKFSAVELFVERTISVDPTYRFSTDRLAVAIDICHRLSGIPLAIELAAARVPQLGLFDVRDRLFEQFLLANGDPGLPERQRTMAATIAWSYNLLGEGERALMRRLATFVGGFTLRAAEIVCRDSILKAQDIPEHFTHLVDVSLVNANTDRDAARYGFADSTRRFALDRLCEADEYQSTARRHAQWLGEMSDRGFLPSGAARLDIVQDATRELENVQAALEWSLSSDSDDDALVAGRILGGMRFLFTASFRRIEFRRLIEHALRRIDPDRNPQIVANLYRGLVQTVSGTEVDDELLRAATAAFERINDYAALANMSAGMISMLLDIGEIDKAEAAAKAGHSFVARGGLEGSHAHIALLMNESEMLTYRGRFDEGRSSLAEARRFIERVDAPELDLYRRSWLATLEAGAGNLQLATQISLDALKLAATLPETPSRSFVADALQEKLALLYCLQSDVIQASALIRAPPQMVLDLPHLHYVKWTLQTVATIAALRLHTDLAAKLLGFIKSSLAAARVRPDFLSQLSYDQCLTSLRSSRTDAELEMLFAEGVRLTFEQACDEALRIVAQ